MKTAATRALLILALIVGVGGACAPRQAFDNPERPVPTPYPEEAAGFGRPELHAEMWGLAHDVERINVIMRRSTGPLTPDEQLEITDLLASMDTRAARLADAGARDFHPVLGKNIDLFRKDLEIARRHASATPPNFFMAGTIAGTCAYCHGTKFDQVHGRIGSP